MRILIWGATLVLACACGVGTESLDASANDAHVPRDVDAPAVDAHRTPSADAGEDAATCSAARVRDGRLELCGSGFGTRSAPMPFHFQDYEAYSPDTLVTDIPGYDAPDPHPGRSILPRVAGDRSHSGGRALKQIYPIVASGEGTFPKVGVSGLNSLELYVALWGYFERTEGTGYRGIFKLVRAGALPSYTGSPRFYESHTGHDSDGVTTANDTGFNTPNAGTTYVSYLGEPPPQGFDAGEWHFLEYYYRLSQPGGAANGAFESWIDGVQNADLTDAVTCDEGSEATIDYTMTLFDGLDGNTGAAFAWWQDDFYADTTRARVVVTDAPEYEASSMWAIQPTIAWDDTRIECTFNSAGFDSGATAYVHVFDAAGALVATSELRVP